MAGWLRKKPEKIGRTRKRWFVAGPLATSGTDKFGQNPDLYGRVNADHLNIHYFGDAVSTTASSKVW